MEKGEAMTSYKIIESRKRQQQVMPILTEKSACPNSCLRLTKYNNWSENRGWRAVFRGRAGIDHRWLKDGSNWSIQDLTLYTNQRQRGRTGNWLPPWNLTSLRHKWRGQRLLAIHASSIWRWGQIEDLAQLGMEKYGVELKPDARM